MIKKLTFIVTALAVVFITGCGSNSNNSTDDGDNKTKHKIAYVTNGIDPFWDLCAAGVRQGFRRQGRQRCFQDAIVDDEEN